MRMRSTSTPSKWIGALVVAIALRGSAAVAEPLPRDQVPEPLRPWVDWVLRGHENETCPFFENAGDRRQCAWPSRLGLDLDEKSGRLTQQWRGFYHSWGAPPPAAPPRPPGAPGARQPPPPAPPG